MSSLSRKLILATLLLLPSLAKAADTNGLIFASGLTHIFNGDSSNGYDTAPLNNSNDSYEIVFPSEAAGSLTELCTLHSSRNSGNPPVVTLSLQGVNTATGRADGTTKQSGGATCTYDPPNGVADDGKQVCCTLGTPHTVALGDLLAMHVTSATADGSNNSTFAVSVTGNNQVRLGFPYAITILDCGAASFKARQPVFAYKVGSQYYGYPQVSAFQTQYSQDTASIDERALAFTLPTTMCSTAVLRGVNCAVTAPATGKQANVILYSGTTALQTAAIYGDVKGGGGGSANDRYLRKIVFPGAETLTCGNQYFVGFQPTATATNFALVEVNFQSAALIGALPFGVNMFLATRVDTGSWDTTTYANRRPACDLVLSDLTVPASGSGPKQNTPASGGMQ